ncbi:MAG TPA: DEAD/DEAH box helicase family protein, partial [Longimicrobium sp.]|nr:DEAD/DEAH box helicase family protein [Longimicrobium sp.]
MKAAEVERVLSQLKDFQRRTVDYVFQRMYLDPEPSRRFLVADEVGLGKTLVARGVIARVLHHRTRRRQTNIVYVCSNAAIAQQNIRRLSVSDETRFAPATRLTLLPTQREHLQAGRINFVSFTPGTTLDLKSRSGTVEERVVLYRMLLQAMPRLDRPLLRVLQGWAGRDNWIAATRQQRPIDAALSAAFVERVRGDGLDAEVIRLCDQLRYRRNRTREDMRACDELVGSLRQTLARVCVDALRPDLIILDEFQRFKDLFHGDSDAGELAQALVRSGPGRDTRVLLLSATPYRALALNHDEDDHYTDFIRTLDFLFDDPAPVEAVRSDLAAYRQAIFGLGAGAGEEASVLRDRIEARLRRVIVRTERVRISERQDAMLIERRIPAPLAADDLRQALLVDGVSGAVGAHDPIEYWKSAPYLLNFMRGYDLKRRLRAVVTAHPESLLPFVEGHRSGLLRRERMGRYEPLEPANARLRALMTETLDAGQWRLLWIPPSLPYLEPEGAYRELQGTTKSLLFSAWQVVPDAIAALCSYEAERRMLGDRTSLGRYEELTKKHTPLLRFAEADGRLTGMPTLALLYPCVTLAREIDPLHLSLELGGGRPMDRESAIRACEARIETLLREAGVDAAVAEGAGDQHWYWASLALLDSGMPGVEAWVRSPAGWENAVATRAASDDSESHLHRHIQAFRPAEPGSLGRVPADLARVLAEFALGSPAICALRALARQAPGLEYDHPAMLGAAARAAAGFRTLFNLPETSALLRAQGEEVYWRAVLEHGISGNLQAVLDEYAHMLRESLGLTAEQPATIVGGIAGEMAGALSLRTVTLQVEEIRKARGHDRLEIGEFPLRCRFALRLGDARTDEEKTLHRVGAVRQAFNSPFRPFILAST